MRKKTTCFFVLLFLVTLSSTCWSQQKPTVPFGFHFEKKRKKKITIPFEVYSNLIVLKLSIDGVDSLNFVLDTGVSSILITDPSLSSRLNSNFVRTVTITGAGDEEPLQGHISIGHTVKIESLRAFRQNIVVLSEDVLKLSEYMGIPIHGIFGHDLFVNFVVSLDYSSKLIEITKPLRFRHRRKHGNKYPLVVTNSKPYTDAFSITAVGGEESVPVRLVVDTGAAHAILLSTTSETIPLPRKTIKADLGRGLNGKITGHMGRLRKLSMGDLVVYDVLASFPDSTSFSKKFPASDYSRQGSIGCEFLRRFKLTLHYQKGYMALKPIPKKLKESFEHDMSGLSILAKGERFDKFVVATVSSGSPADKAGIQIGDTILFVNNKNAEDLNINDIISMFSKKEGNKVEIFLRRNGDLQFVSFYLKRII